MLDTNSPSSDQSLGRVANQWLSEVYNSSLRILATSTPPHCLILLDILSSTQLSKNTPNALSAHWWNQIILKRHEKTRSQPVLLSRPHTRPPHKHLYNIIRHSPHSPPCSRLNIPLVPRAI